MHTRATSEEREALRFIRKYGIGDLPGRRFPNGESNEAQRSDWLGGRDRIGSNAGGSHSRMVSYDQFGTLVQWEDWMLDQNRDYVPLVGTGTERTLTQVEKDLRMRHVLSFLLPMHIDLLFERHLVGRTLDDIASDFGVTRQAIIKRLRVATQDFKREFAAHWNDDIPLDDLVEREEGA